VPPGLSRVSFSSLLLLSPATSFVLRLGMAQKQHVVEQQVSSTLSSFSLGFSPFRRRQKSEGMEQKPRSAPPPPSPSSVSLRHISWQERKGSTAGVPRFLFLFFRHMSPPFPSLARRGGAVGDEAAGRSPRFLPLSFSFLCRTCLRIGQRDKNRNAPNWLPLPPLRPFSFFSLPGGS